jgi:hypothetical protein
LFKSHDRIQEEATQVKTNAWQSRQQQVKKTAAVENSWASCQNMKQIETARKVDKKELSNAAYQLRGRHPQHPLKCKERRYTPTVSPTSPNFVQGHVTAVGN